MIRQTAEVENNMNSVERIVHYSTEIEQEAPYEIPDKKPPVLWPAEGRIVLKAVVFRYRPELPAVLQGLSMDVEAGEKIGIVGR
jgi:ABC-type bacteriocin/lantibiotic exporter with double-glycine peptidase domain